MKKSKIETLARILCIRNDNNPDALVPGGDAIQTDWDETLYNRGKYVEKNIPDGTTSLGEPAHYSWRDYIFDAKVVFEVFGFSEID